jgi:hypothetical protein
MRYIVTVFILFVIIITNVNSQKIGNIWYFGRYCGITFKTPDGKPKAITDNRLEIWEGCATISNKAGDIEFYTDGINVLTKNHDWMHINYSYRKFYLNGCSSSSQSAIIIPFPEDSLKYYIFTAECFENQQNSKGINYSIVDMTSNNGFGNIFPYNINIAPSSLEKITAVKHRNGIDYWIISHAYNSDIFYSFLVDDSGIHTPVISRIVPIIGDYDNGGDQGYLKVSSNGKKLAAAYTQLKNIYIYNFDNSNGYISSGDPLFDSNNEQEFYGVEFSPDASKLYASFFGLQRGIYQFNLNAGDINAIRNSAVLILDEKGFPPGAMQLGPDGKIYVAKDVSPYLHVINHPNRRFPACDLELDALFLDIDNTGRRCHLGLPNAMTSIYYIRVHASATIPACEGDTVILTADIDASAEGYSVKWTGPNNFVSYSKDTTIYNIQKSATGWYYVSVNLNDKTAIDSVFVKITDSPFTEIIPSVSTEFCEGDSITLKASPFNPQLNYYWSTGEQSEQIVVRKSGRYFLRVVNSGNCEFLDSIDITVVPKPEINIMPLSSLNFCEGDSVVLGLQPYNPDVHYTWSTGENTRQITVCSSGEYKVIARNATGCTDSSSVIVSVLPLPDALIVEGNEITICYGDSIELHALPDKMKYFWSTGDTTQSITVRNAGLYFLIVSNENDCRDTAFCFVNLYPKIQVEITGNTSICKGDSSLLSLTTRFEHYIWSTGDTTASIYAKERGLYTVRTIDSNGCKSSNSIYINVYEVSINSTELDSIDFGRIFIDSTKSISVTIINEDYQDITIGNISFKNSILLHHNNTLPANVSPAASYDINITFSPYDILNFRDSIIVEIASPCHLRLSGFIKGSGIVKIMALLPDTTGEIGANDFCIPVYSYFKTKRNIKHNSAWQMKISHNATLFQPAQYVTSVISGINRITALQGSSEISNRLSIMTKYCGTVLLGNADYTQLHFDELNYYNSNIIVETIDGSLKLNGLCVRNLSRLEPLESSYLQVTPSPANDEINIEYKLSESGNLSIKLVNTSTQTSKVIINNGNVKKDKYFLHYDTGSLVSGTYFLIMQINDKVIYKKIIIIR